MFLWRNDKCKIKHQNSDIFFFKLKNMYYNAPYRIRLFSICLKEGIQVIDYPSAPNVNLRDFTPVNNDVSVIPDRQAGYCYETEDLQRRARVDFQPSIDEAPAKIFLQEYFIAG